jgi:peptidoglycan/LPS O-acetylase OafA/YrhL
MAGVISSLLLVATLLIPDLDLLSVVLIPLLILCLLDDNFIARALRMRAMKFLGEISYALYLMHGDVLVITERLLATHPAQMVWRPAAITVALVFFVAFVIAASYAVHKLFEVPARAWVRRLEVVFDRSAKRTVVVSEQQGQEDMS